MRILVDYRPALRARTGVGEYIHETCRHLARSLPSPADLCLFSASWKDRLDPSSVPGTCLVDRRVPGQLLHAAWHRLEWPPVEWLGAGSFDIVQSGHPLLLPSRSAAQIVTICDLDFLDHPERTTREIRRDYPALARSHATRADQVVVISEHTAHEVTTRLGVSPERISVCTPGAPDWPMRRGEPEEGCILFLGTLEPRKNLDVLVDAYARLLETRPTAPRLVLAGRIDDRSAPMIERIRRSRFADRVDIPGYVSPETRESWYQRALVFVMPSHTEGFGMPVVEAMTVGVPVVAANRGALVEAAGPSSLLMDPEDAGALAAAIGLLLDDPARRQRMADEGRRHAEQFTWARTAAGWTEAWARALAHRRARRA